MSSFLMLTHDVPVVPVEDRIQMKRLGKGFWKIEAWYGFKEQPDVADILDTCRLQYGLAFDPMETSYFLSRETIVCAGERPGMATWRDHLFAWMNRNATRYVWDQAADLPQLLSDGNTLYVPGVGQWNGR